MIGSHNWQIPVGPWTAVSRGSSCLACCPFHSAPLCPCLHATAFSTAGAGLFPCGPRSPTLLAQSAGRNRGCLTPCVQKSSDWLSLERKSTPGGSAFPGLGYFQGSGVACPPLQRWGAAPLEWLTLVQERQYTHSQSRSPSDPVRKARRQSASYRGGREGQKESAALVTWPTAGRGRLVQTHSEER